MVKSAAGWFYLSGAISIALCAALFAGLMAFMLYRAPVITLSGDIFSDDFVVSEEWLKSLKTTEVDLTAIEERKDETASARQKSAASVKELFGETNSTVKPEDLLMPTKDRFAGRAAAPDKPSETEREGRDLRVETPKLTAFSAISTGAGSPSQGGAAQKSLENRYYQIAYRRIYSAWQPAASDLGKIAWIQMRVDRDGSFTYRITSAASDPFFMARVIEAIEKVQRERLDPPPRNLTFNVKFDPKEQQ